MTRIWTASIGLVSLSALLIGGAVTADAAMRSEKSRMQQDDRQSQRSSDWQKITGTIKGTKNVGLRNRDQENLVVQLQTKQGRKRIVDLGDVENLEDLDIQKGDKITAWGRTFNIDDKQVFMARKLKADGETISIDRPELSQLSRQQMGRQSRESQSTRRPSRIKGEVIVKGEVLDFDRDGFYIVEDPSGRQTHLIISEEMDQGFDVGDRIQAQVKPDGTVTSISRMEGGASGRSSSRMDQRTAQGRQFEEEY